MKQLIITITFILIALCITVTNAQDIRFIPSPPCIVTELSDREIAYMLQQSISYLMNDTTEYSLVPFQLAKSLRYRPKDSLKWLISYHNLERSYKYFEEFVDSVHMNQMSEACRIPVRKVVEEYPFLLQVEVLKTSKPYEEKIPFEFNTFLQFTDIHKIADSYYFFAQLYTGTSHDENYGYENGYFFKWQSCPQTGYLFPEWYADASKYSSFCGTEGFKHMPKIRLYGNPDPCKDSK